MHVLELLLFGLNFVQSGITTQIHVLNQTDFYMIFQIVGSAPGFPHGIIDPIEVIF